MFVLVVGLGAAKVEIGLLDVAGVETTGMVAEVVEPILLLVMVE